MAVTAAAPAQSQSWKPTRNIEIIVGAGAGGGADATARVMQKLMQERLLQEVSSSVVNKTGGGSSVSYIYLNQHAGDAHYLALSLQPLVTGAITGTSSVSYADVTPLAHLFNEYVGFGVRPDAAIRSGKDLAERLKRDPGSVSIGLTTALGGSNHLAAALAMKAAGVDIRKMRIVVFSGAGESMSAVMGGHVDVVALGAFSLDPLFKAGKLRGIAVSAPHRLGEAYAEVPTWKELGINSVFSNWRGVVGPKAMTPAQIAYWDGVLGRLAHDPEWNADLLRRAQEPDYRNSAETRRFLAQQYDELRGALVELGMAK
jgi:putative tricarboxylic transport membrane protein